ncbi:MAG: Trm112 family protein [Candidatus Omnitrophica bacterium]|nr:Trm112 family protein [Candidatus Omnitrophota bacterium]MBI2173839.1 Trm112 family protein [Candidatus Omnitrophota bacterium]MBI3010515.1 Trm112 family protein [Candidatus Omnitrophota bacterium]
MMDHALLDLLACPACKTKVQLEGEWLLCVSCNRRYPIRDGIPVMLLEEARMPESTGGEPHQVGG